MATPKKPWELKQTQLNSTVSPDEIITPSETIFGAGPTDSTANMNQVNLDSTPALGDSTAEAVANG